MESPSDQQQMVGWTVVGLRSAVVTVAAVWVRLQSSAASPVVSSVPRLEWLQDVTEEQKAKAKVNCSGLGPLVSSSAPGFPHSAMIVLSACPDVAAEMMMMMTTMDGRQHSDAADHPSRDDGLIIAARE